MSTDGAAPGAAIGKKALILIADDEPKFVRAMQINLEARGFGVITAANGLAAVTLTASEQPDLIILDVRMPEMDGWEACRRIREFSTVPIIMLTALGEESDKIKGLDAGADDYVTKPFSAQELLARVRASLRRAEFSGAQEPRPAVRAGDVLLDFVGRRVFAGGQEVSLTATEYRLLCELVRYAGQVLVPEYLLEKVWGAGYEQSTGLLQQAVHRLRRKLEAAGSAGYIRTRRGLGYVFVLPGSRRD